MNEEKLQSIGHAHEHDEMAEIYPRRQQHRYRELIVQR